jgi:hypothetical protein
MDLKELGGGSMDYIDVIQDKDKWSALVDTVISLVFP